MGIVDGDAKLFALGAKITNLDVNSGKIFIERPDGSPGVIHTIGRVNTIVREKSVEIKCVVDYNIEDLAEKDDEDVPS